MKHLIYILIGLWLASCGGATNDEPTIPVAPVEPAAPVEPNEVPMAFGAAIAEWQRPSRDGSNALDPINPFKVYSYKHTAANTTQTVMGGYIVELAQGVWTYQGVSNPAGTQYLKYWDASALSYDFYAFAPIDGSFTVDPETGMVTIADVSAHAETVSGTSADLLVAHTRRSITALTDQDCYDPDNAHTKPTAFYSTVPLRFHHIFSHVEFRIYNTGSKTAELQNFEVKLDDGKSLIVKGDLQGSEWINTTTIQYPVKLNYLDSEPQTLAPIAAADKETASSVLTSYYELSQVLDSKLNVSLLVDGQLLEGSFDIDGGKWAYDHNYVYYIHIEVNKGQEPILVGITVQDFEKGTDIDDEQNNW